MQFITKFKNSLFGVNKHNFEEHALAAFGYQARHNAVYAEYLKHLGCRVEQVGKLEQIPFLPIEFFKWHRVSSTEAPAQAVFESSGTTGAQASRHHVADLAFYDAVSVRTFEQFYGPLSGYTVYALLPSYLERGQSSLVHMANHFMQKAAPGSGFYLHHTQPLAQALQSERTAGKKLLIGVTFALLDLAEQLARPLANTIVMETGGMKGRRREMLREELHQQLQAAWQVPAIHAEYGMTELLSQAYSQGGGQFRGPAWWRVLLREPNDPFHIGTHMREGGINIIDLANIDSCCFIETKDIGALHPQQATFSVLGRYDNSDLRGCNLMVA